jgi:hypothetical protein
MDSTERACRSPAPRENDGNGFTRGSVLARAGVAAAAGALAASGLSLAVCSLPRSFQPESVGDRNYSPLVRIVNVGGHSYDASIVANGDRAVYRRNARSSSFIATSSVPGSCPPDRRPSSVPMLAAQPALR